MSSKLKMVSDSIEEMFEKLLPTTKFSLQKSQKWPSYVKIISLHETCKYHKRVFDTEIFFRRYLKRSLRLFANFRVSLHKYAIATPLCFIEGFCLFKVINFVIDAMI